MKKFKKRLKITAINMTMLAQLLISGGVLAHDLFIWGIKPLFTGQFLLVTYFGMFIDFIAIGLCVSAYEYFKDFYSK